MELSKGAYASERFAQVLVRHDAAPPSFGNLILGENTYAVSFMDDNHKIPKWAQIKLAPHMSTDMHGSIRKSYMVGLENSEEEPREQLEELAKKYRNDEVIVSAVHIVRNVSGNDSNGKGRIIRSIKPSQNFYYQTNDLLISLSQHQNVFRAAVMDKLLEGESHESLHDFKHIVNVVKVGTKTEYQYALPADLPEVFTQRLQAVDIEATRPHGDKVQATFKVSRHEPHVLPFRPRTAKDPKETGITSVYERFVLSPQQDYMSKYLRNGGAKLVHFDVPSTTCAEKCSLLNLDPYTLEKWSLDNIVSAHYFSGPEGYAVLVGPRIEEVPDPEGLIKQITGCDEIKRSEILSESMERGTCTPFVNSNFGKVEINKIVLLSLPGKLMQEQADYSIGGRGPSAHRASIQMTPNLAEHILRKEFGPKVINIAHPYQQYW